MNKNTYVVIMAGGIGSRFWPASRESKPKQFMDLLGTGKSLLVHTFERFSSIIPRENIIIVTNKKYEPIIREQIPDLGDHQVLKEHVGKNTAPCIAYAAFKIRKLNPDATMVVAPSDHAIFNETRFHEVILSAVEKAEKEEVLITLGIQPHKPETGYGYIQYILDDGSEFKKVKTFTEKPELELAQKFLESGDFVWNSGMFIWNNNVILSAIEEHLPDVYEIFQEAEKDINTKKEQDSIDLAYSQCKNESVDYGIMEKASDVFVVPVDIGWSDLGSWAALHEISEKDEDNNYADAEALLFDVNNSVIYGPKDKLIVVDGLQDYLVADHGNALLICKKDDERKFRQIFGEVKKNKGNKFL